jgi:hypothetical protein
VTQKDLQKIVDDIAIAINHLVSDLESRESRGEILGPAEVRAVARRLQAHVASLMSAIGRMR